MAVAVIVLLMPSTTTTRTVIERANDTLCNNHAAAIYDNNGIVNNERYRCECLPSYTGQYCDRCVDVQGWDQYPNCCPPGRAMWPNCTAYCTSASSCNNLALTVKGTMETCHCNCRTGYEGLACERCHRVTQGIRTVHLGSVVSVAVAQATRHSSKGTLWQGVSVRVSLGIVVLLVTNAMSTMSATQIALRLPAQHHTLHVATNGLWQMDS